MAIFGRRIVRTWRTGAYSNRLLNDNGRISPPTETRRMGALLLGLAFYAAIVLIINLGEPPLDIRINEVARRDYRARITFVCPDNETTEQLKTRKADREPNVYRFSPEVLDSTRNACVTALRKILGKAGPDETTPTGDVLTLTPEQLTLLRTALTPMGDSAIEAMKRIFTDPALTMVIRDQEYENEIKEYDHLWISVIMKEGQPSTRVNIYDVVTLEEKLPTRLESLVAREFKDLTPEAQALLTELIRERFRDPTLQYDEKETKLAREKARNQVQTVNKTITQGETILPAGAVATPSRIMELDRERREFYRTQPLSSRVKRMVGSALLLGLLCFGFGLYMYGFHGQHLQSLKRLAIIGAICVVMVALAKLLAYAGWSVLLVPVPFVAMMFSLLFNQRVALGVTGLLAMMIGIIASFNINVFLVIVVGGLIAAMATSTVRTRTKLVNVGIFTGLIQCACVWAVNLASDANIGAEFWNSVAFQDSLLALANGVLSGFLITGLLPFIERAFGIVTDISLLEWSDVNRPLLRRLILEAPGTYHHSLLVGNLAEAAARAIGANALLARTAAYYHDIGKLIKPEYFVENTLEAPQRHEKLSPALSALIITAHTRDGVQIALENRIPLPIRDVIEQHHGTTLVEYFYQLAVQRSGGDGHVDPECFRYRGPKPQTREAGIVLLADAVESASRVMTEPTPSRIESLVRDLTQRRLADAQFDDCPLTIKELRTVEQSLIRELTAMFHTRIRYPRL